MFPVFGIDLIRRDFLCTCACTCAEHLSESMTKVRKFLRIRSLLDAGQMLLTLFPPLLNILSLPSTPGTNISVFYIIVISRQQQIYLHIYNRSLSVSVHLHCTCAFILQTKEFFSMPPFFESFNFQSEQKL